MLHIKYQKEQKIKENCYLIGLCKNYYNEDGKSKRELLRKHKNCTFILHTKLLIFA